MLMAVRMDHSQTGSEQALDLAPQLIFDLRWGDSAKQISQGENAEIPQKRSAAIHERRYTFRRRERALADESEMDSHVELRTVLQEIQSRFEGAAVGDEGQRLVLLPEDGHLASLGHDRGQVGEARVEHRQATSVAAKRSR